MFPNTATATIYYKGNPIRIAVTEDETPQMYRAALGNPFIPFEIEWPTKDQFTVCKHIDPTEWQVHIQRIEQSHG